MSVGWGLLPIALPGGVGTLGWGHSEALGRGSREGGSRETEVLCSGCALPSELYQGCAWLQEALVASKWASTVVLPWLLPAKGKRLQKREGYPYPLLSTSVQPGKSPRGSPPASNLASSQFLLQDRTSLGCVNVEKTPTLASPLWGTHPPAMLSPWLYPLSERVCLHLGTAPRGFYNFLYPITSHLALPSSHQAAPGNPPSLSTVKT